MCGRYYEIIPVRDHYRRKCVAFKFETIWTSKKIFHVFSFKLVSGVPGVPVLEELYYFMRIKHKFLIRIKRILFKALTFAGYNIQANCYSLEIN